jgi:hypothetical protein
MAELSSNLKVFLARELERQFTSLDNSVMMFISNVDNSGSSSESLDNEIVTRRQIQTAKLLSDNTVALMIPRVNWTDQTIYQRLISSEERKNLNFYVYNSEGNVYACLDNGGGRPSIDEPTGTSTDLIYLQNGYVWKFLFKVPTTLLDFIDANWIPIKEVPLYEGKPFAYADEQQLQYGVQYSSQGGQIESIGVVDAGDEYLAAVKPSLEYTVATATTTTVTLDGRSSNVDDFYNNYSIRIFDGTGSGQIRKITDYVGSTKLATLASAWTVLPNNTSKFEIIPTIEITGDGTAASAYAKMSTFEDKFITSVIMVDKGSNYSFASFRVLPEPSSTGKPTVLNANISPTNGIGREPLFDLIAKRLSVLIKIEGNESGRAILGNEYSQFGLWLSPNIGIGYNNSGQIAGTEGMLRTTVDIAPTSGALPSNWASAAQNDYVFGSSSYNTGKVVSFQKINDSNGQLVLDGLNSPFKRNETLYVFKPSVGGTYEFRETTATVTNTLFPDSTRSSVQDVYRCTHKLRVHRSDDVFNDAAPQTDIPFDSAVTGSCGSVGNVAGFENTSGNTTDIFITNVVRGATSDAIGFTGGETLIAGPDGIVLDIINAYGPELNLFSGTILYISSVDEVTRNAEQIDLFKINFDF